MKKITNRPAFSRHFFTFFLAFVSFSAIGFAQRIDVEPTRCSCEPDNQITITLNNGNVYATSNMTSQAYYWKICSGPSTIIGSNTNKTININYQGNSILELVRFNNGVCSVSCIELNDGNCIPDPLPTECDASASHQCWIDYVTCGGTNTRFDSIITGTNPFSNSANVQVNINATVHPSVCFLTPPPSTNVAAGSSFSLPFQFRLYTNPNFNQPGFVVHYIVTYTDNITGDICTKEIQSASDSVCFAALPPTNSFNISPNPVSDVLNIVVSTEEHIDLETRGFEAVLYNFKGIEVTRQHLDTKNQTMDVSKLQKGFYVLHLLDQGRIADIKNVVVE